MLHGDVYGFGYQASPEFLVVWCFEGLLDRGETEFINDIFPGSSDSLCIRVCDFHFKYLLGEHQLAC